MCDGCQIADLLNDFAAAGGITREQRRIFAELYLDDPSGTAETLARLAERRGRPDLASRARRADHHLEEFHRDFALTFPGLRDEVA